MDMTPHFSRLRPALAAALCLSLSLGCTLHKAQQAFKEGRYEDSLTAYREVIKKDPTNVQARIGLRRSAALASEKHLEKAREAERKGQPAKVGTEVRAALLLDPSNTHAQEWMLQLEKEAELRRAKAATEESIESVRQRGEGKPTSTFEINPRSLESLDLNFSRKTSVREIFATLSKTTGVNILLHSSFQDSSISVDLRGLNFQRILDSLMLQNDLFYKVLDNNSIMIFKATPANRQQFENQVIKTFYLSSATADDVKGIFSALQPEMKTFVDKRLNAITIKAKPHELSVASRIVKQMDKAKPEVMVYMELLEVTESNKEQVGLIPVVSASDTTGTYRMGATLDGAGSLNSLTGSLKISSSSLQYLLPNLALDALKSSGDAKLVASPNVRVVSGETGEVNIGDKVSTTQSSIGSLSSTSTSTTTSSLSNLTASTSYSYEDVGVKIKVEPRVHFNGDITIKIESEVKTLKSSSTAGRPDMGQRIIKTSARLREGETAIFAGMLKDDEQKTKQGIWGLSDIPVIGSLLSSHGKAREKTDVLLTIRAALVRRPDLQAEDFEAFDPDLATSKNGPFSPRPDAKVKHGAPTQLGPSANPTPEPEAAPKEPVAKEPVAKEPVAKENAAKEAPEDSAKATAKTEAAANDLVCFLSPMSIQTQKGQHFQLALQVSGGKGVTSGSMDIQIDPKLKLNQASAGDFLTAEGGNLEQSGKDGLWKFTFKRPTANADSGTLVNLDLEALDGGNAPVLVQNSSYLVNANPIPGRVINALVTVE
ncbi:MAG: pulQ [Holophagaceae bacterium]|nr:pulQ [Holophagaceae bacterium]